jgi:hypothetical protein
MILIPIKCINAKKKVIINELVIVNEYGISPTRLAIRINKNMNNQIVKYEFRAKFVFELLTL